MGLCWDRATRHSDLDSMLGRKDLGGPRLRLRELGRVEIKESRRFQVRMQGTRQFQAKTEGARWLQARTEGALSSRPRWKEFGGSWLECRELNGFRLKQKEFGDSIDWDEGSSPIQSWDGLNSAALGWDE